MNKTLRRTALSGLAAGLIAAPALAADRIDALKLPEASNGSAPAAPAAFVHPTIRGHLDHRNFMPATNGATGLIDVPVAMTVPKNEWVLSFTREGFDADSTWWTPTYRDVKGSTEIANVAYGIAKNVEVNASVEVWDRRLGYFDAVGGVDPVFQVDGKVFGGFGAKWSLPEGEVFGKPFAVATGFRVQPRGSDDRDFTELHEHERLNHVYATATARPSESFYLHAMLKLVVVDAGGDRPASGARAGFPGFSIPATWLQPGVAAEWWLLPNVSLFGEAIWDADIDWLGGVPDLAINGGLRWQGERFGAGGFARRLNHDGLGYYGVQASMRFP